MQTIRTFIAIPLAPAIESGARRLIKQLKPFDTAIKWVPADNLHLTLKFLGEVDNVEIPKVCKSIRRVTNQIEPFELTFTGTGGFPEISRPRVLFAGVEDPSGSLVRMVNSLETELATLGFKPEPRDYRPHLTIGRARSRSHRASAELLEAVKQHESQDLGEMLVEEVQLVASFLDKAGPTYQVMDTVEIGSEADSETR
ncbi:MAG: RNA 2',3'-cyclic phosphodiesterase [Planctomycetota bacterium]